mgnify:CR=1 FL=1
MTVGERIKKVRETLGINQVDFAAEINVSKQTLYKYENNLITNIPSDKIEAIARCGHVSPAYLMGWTEQDEVFATYKFDEILNEYVHDLGGFLYHHPLHKQLFDDVMDVKKDDIPLAHEMLERINGTSQHIQYFEADAANARTDLDIPDGTDTSDNDIMDDENF